VAAVGTVVGLVLFAILSSRLVDPRPRDALIAGRSGGRGSRPKGSRA
jgi:hypothetical protein